MKKPIPIEAIQNFNVVEKATAKGTTLHISGLYGNSAFAVGLIETNLLDTTFIIKIYPRVPNIDSSGEINIELLLPMKTEIVKFGDSGVVVWKKR